MASTYFLNYQNLPVVRVVVAGKSTYSKGGGQPNSMRAYKGGGGVKKAKNRAYVLYG